MARPKRLYSGETQIRFARQPFGLGDTDGRAPGVRQRNRWEAYRKERYPQRAGNQCPMTAWHVLDALLAIDENVELRAKELADWLNGHMEAFVWEPITVGKHLADLKDAFEDLLGPRMGLLLGGRDWRGNFYHVNRTPETVTLAWGVLDDLMRLGEIEVLARRRGRKTDFMGSVLLECPSLRGAWRGMPEEEAGE